MKTKYMIVISFDAVSSSDLEKLKKLPNFSKIIKDGSVIREVETIYPSLTYPAHATIVTGKYPGNHGIINNTKLEIGQSNPDWYWYSKSINGKTLFDIAEEKQLKTCSILWPVTAKGKITYNMPEIFCTKPWHNQIIRSALSGSLIYQLDMNNRFGHLRKGIKQPYLDNFAMEVAKATILEKKPNLLCLHLVDVDSQKHYFGIDSKQVDEALIRHDNRLGEIIDTLKKANIFEESTIVLLGDHSQINANKVIRLNKVFLENNLISLNKKGNIKSYKAIAKSADGSCYIYLKDKNDKYLKDRVRAVLSDIAKENNSAIEKIFSQEEVIKLGADKICDFMIEAKKGYYFLDDIIGSFIENVKEEEVSKVPHIIKATHGYLPNKEKYTTFFIAYGKVINKGKLIERGQLINHGPTLAKILGLDLENVDGRVEEKIFK